MKHPQTGNTTSTEAESLLFDILRQQNEWRNNTKRGSLLR